LAEEIGELISYPIKSSFRLAAETNRLAACATQKRQRLDTARRLQHHVFAAMKLPGISPGNSSYSR